MFDLPLIGIRQNIVWRHHARQLLPLVALVPISLSRVAAQAALVLWVTSFVFVSLYLVPVAAEVDILATHGYGALHPSRQF